MNSEISALADTLVALRFKQEPLEAALLGLVEGDVGLADLSATFENETLTAYEGIVDDAVNLRERLMNSENALDEVDLVALDHIQLSATTNAEHLRVQAVPQFATIHRRRYHCKRAIPLGSCHLLERD